MRYLITGGAGFIGSHLAEKILTGGDEVIIIDDLSTGRIDNIRHLLDNPRLTFIHRSLSDTETLEEFMRRCDVVLHLAAAVGVKLIVNEPVQSIETNIFGTQVVLDLANKYRKKVLLTSTSEVYGKSENYPFKEEDDMLLGPTTKQRWSYACSKAIDEFLAISFYRATALPVTIVRLFNTVGPRQVSDYGMVIPRFIEQALTNKSLTVYGDGKQIRCFIHVSDVVNIITGLLETKGAEGEVFNVGSDQQISIEDLAKKIISLTDSPSELVYIPYEKVYGQGFEDIRVRVPDIGKLHRTIDYQRKYQLEDILEEVIAEKKASLQ